MRQADGAAQYWQPWLGFHYGVRPWEMHLLTPRDVNDMAAYIEKQAEG